MEEDFRNKYEILRRAVEVYLRECNNTGETAASIRAYRRDLRNLIGMEPVYRKRSYMSRRRYTP